MEAAVVNISVTDRAWIAHAERRWPALRANAGQKSRALARIAGCSQDTAAKYRRLVGAAESKPPAAGDDRLLDALRAAGMPRLVSLSIPASMEARA